MLDESDISLDEMASLDHLLDEFERSLDLGTANLHDFSARLSEIPERLRKTALVDLIVLDMAKRWSLENPESRPTVEQYLSRFPQLGPVENSPAALWVEEFRLRLRSGEATCIEEIIARHDPRSAEFIEALRLVSADGTETWPSLNPLATKGVDQQASFPISFGDYELLEEIARGGMGIVFKARQIALDRIVALKMIKTGNFASREEVERFQLDANAAARLRHPNCVPIYESGEFHGQHFFTMGFVEGQDLAKWIDIRSTDGSPPCTGREAAALLIKITGALNYIHQKGIIHRDLKPANILMDEHGEPLVTDFGLAKQVESDSSLTRPDQILGTPYYMPPEQAAGDPEQIGTTSDIYSCGAILFHLLTGRPPFQGNSVAETLTMVIAKSPPSPRTFNRKLEKDIETICLKCLEKNIGHRFQSASELHEELNRFLNGSPIRSRPIGFMESAWRLVRQNPILSGLTMLFFVTLVAATLLSTRFGLNALAEKKRADDESQKVTRQKQISDSQRLQTQLRNTRFNTRSFNSWTSEAHALLSEYQTIAEPMEYKFQYATTMMGVDYHPVKGLGKQSGSSIAFSLDGTRMAVSGVDGNRSENFASIVDLEKISISRSPSTAHSGPIAFADDTPLEVIWPIPGELHVRRLLDHGVVNRLKFAQGSQHPPVQRQWAISKDGTTVAALVQLEDGTRVVRAWRLMESNPFFEVGIPATSEDSHISELEKPSAQIALSKDGRKLAVGDNVGEIRVWNTNNSILLQRFRFEFNAVSALEFCRRSARNQQALIAGYVGGAAVIWDLENSIPQLICRGSHHAVYAICTNSDGTILVTGGRSEVNLWDAATGVNLMTLRNPGSNFSLDYVMAIAYSPDDQWLAMAGKSGHDAGENVHLWRSISPLPSIRELRGLNGSVDKIEFSEDGKFLASLTQNWELAVWDLESESGSLLHLFRVPQADFSDNSAIAFSHDHQRMAYCNGNRAILFDLKTGEILEDWDDLAYGMQNNLVFNEQGRLMLIRFETLNRIVRPFSQKQDRTTNPFKSRVYQLQDGGQFKMLAESAESFYHISQIVVSNQGIFHAIRGRKSFGDPTTVFCLDSATGKLAWSKKGYSIKTDRNTNSLFLYRINEENTPTESRFDFRKGNLIVSTPKIATAQSGLTRLDLSRRNDAEKIPQFDIYFGTEKSKPDVSFGFDRIKGATAKLPVFSRDARYLAWGDQLSSVFVVDVRRLKLELEHATRSGSTFTSSRNP